MPSWTNEADLALFTILLRQLQSLRVRIPYADIAAEFGLGITDNAVRNRLQRLRDVRHDILDPNNSGAAGSS